MKFSWKKAKGKTVEKKWKEVGIVTSQARLEWGSSGKQHCNFSHWPLGLVEGSQLECTRSDWSWKTWNLPNVATCTFVRPMNANQILIGVVGNFQAY